MGACHVDSDRLVNRVLKRTSVGRGDAFDVVDAIAGRPGVSACVQSAFNGGPQRRRRDDPATLRLD